jgi:hypothetical protein
MSSSCCHSVCCRSVARRLRLLCRSLCCSRSGLLGSCCSGLMSSSCCRSVCCRSVARRLRRLRLCLRLTLRRLHACAPRRRCPPQLAQFSHRGPKLLVFGR